MATNTKPMVRWRYVSMWDAIASLGSRGTKFYPRDVIRILVQEGWNRKTAELNWNKFILWATHNDDEFNGPKSRLEKFQDGYRLVDKELT